MFPSYFVFVNKTNFVCKSLDLLLNIILAYKESLPQKSVCGGGGVNFKLFHFFILNYQKENCREKK